MIANTVYEVFLALSFEEREKLIVSVNNHKKLKIKMNQKSKISSLLSSEEAINYLKETVFTLK